MESLFYSGAHESDSKTPVRPPCDANVLTRWVGHFDPIWGAIVNQLRADGPAAPFHLDWSYKLMRNQPPVPDRPVIQREPCTDGHFWHHDAAADVTYCAECGAPYEKFV